MNETEELAELAGPQWTVAGYRFELIPTVNGWRWGVSARGIGVGGLRTPLCALVRHTQQAGLPWHQVPGYGIAYRGAQRWLHGHGYCVLRRRWPTQPSWRCSWCGNRISLT